jgi:hypothetical protein
MKSRDGRQKDTAERVEIQKVSLVSRGASWVILKLLSMTLLTVVAGIGFAAFKYFVPGDAPPPLPAPYSPAAVAASPAPPIDYRQHPPPAGLTDNVPLPRSTYAPPPPPLPRSPPLPAAAHVPPHRPVTRPAQYPGAPPLPR